MPRKPKNGLTRCREFLVHEPTNSVGLVIEVRRVDGKAQKTIELAGCELISAVIKEFRLATGPEIERHHRAAALVRPFPLPTLPMSRLLTHSSQPGGRPGL